MMKNNKTNKYKYSKPQYKLDAFDNIYNKKEIKTWNNIMDFYMPNPKENIKSKEGTEEYYEEFRNNHLLINNVKQSLIKNKSKNNNK